MSDRATQLPRGMPRAQCEHSREKMMDQREYRDGPWSVSISIAPAADNAAGNDALGHRNYPAGLALDRGGAAGQARRSSPARRRAASAFVVAGRRRARSWLAAKWDRAEHVNPAFSAENARPRRAARWPRATRSRWSGRNARNPWPRQDRSRALRAPPPGQAACSARRAFSTGSGQSRPVASRVAAVSAFESVIVSPHCVSALY